MQFPMTNRVLVLGANGMLGGSIFRYLSRYSEYAVHGTVRDECAKNIINDLGFDDVVSGIDLSKDEELIPVFQDFKPNTVINCVGIIKQLDDSKVPITSVEINSLLPHRLARISSMYGSKLIHFSTDCVFNGERGNYSESDLPDAMDLYGRSKLLGEVDYMPHLTLRTSIIGHGYNGNRSLVDWFLSQKDKVKGFSRAIFSGLPTIYVSELISQFIKNDNLSGIYHIGSTPIDKFSLLNVIKDIYELDIDIEKDKELIIDRSLNSNKIKNEINFTPPSWSVLVKKMYAEYTEYFYDK